MGSQALLLAALLFLHGAASACIHPPKGHPGSLTEREKVAFLFHDGKNAHLVIRTKIASQSGLPENMAWVIPVPALPSKYEEVSDELFRELAELIPRVRPAPKAAPASAKGMPVAKSEAPRIRVHEAQAIGDYRIQPIEILDESAARELNAWLTKNGFDPVSQHDQQYYLKKGAVFLTVRVAGLKGTQSDLKPLHIVYADERMRLPLKFSGHSGVFDVRLYVLTDEPPSRKALQHYGLEVRDVSYRIDERFAQRSPAAYKLVGARSGYVTEFTGTGYNARQAVTSLSEDPWLAPNGSARGGEPGGADHAGIKPEYPLLRVGYQPTEDRVRDAEDWIFIASMAGWLAVALWAFVRNVRHAAGAFRGSDSHRWRRIGNRLMLAGVALVLASIAVFYFKWIFQIWGLLAEYAVDALPLVGLALLATGVLARLAAIWADPEPAS